MNSIQKQVEQTLFSAQVGHHISDERSVHWDRSAVAVTDQTFIVCKILLKGEGGEWHF